MKKLLFLLLSLLVIVTLLRGQQSACVQYEELVALRIDHPGPSDLVLYLRREGDNVRISHSPHFQWKLFINPEEAPGFGDCVYHANTFAIYNEFTGSYLMKDGNGVVLSTANPAEIYQWDIENGTPMLEHFALRNVLTDEQLGLVADYDWNVHFEAYSPANMGFVRRLAPLPSEVVFESLRDLGSDLPSQEPWVYLGDHGLVSPFEVDGYARWFGGQAWRFEWFLTGNMRSTLRGIVEDYGVYHQDNYEEYDWCLKMYPDREEDMWMIDNPYLHPTDEFVTSTNPEHYGATLVEAELTPNHGVFHQFPWLPTPSSEDEDPNYPVEGRQVYVYGPYCYDLGHDGKPEIHPIDAIWWKDTYYTGSGEKWYFGGFQDGSDRFEDNWSRAPRVLDFLFPFSVRIPTASERSVTFRAEIEPLSSFSMNTQEVFGPDEPQDEHQRIIRLDDDKFIKVIVSEDVDAYQQTRIIHRGRTGDRYYGAIRITLSVGDDEGPGLYFGSIKLMENRQRDLVLPRFFVFSEFLGRKMHFGQLCDQYAIHLATGDPITAGPNEVSLVVPQTQSKISFPNNRISRSPVTLVRQASGKFVVDPMENVGPVGLWVQAGPLRSVAGGSDLLQHPRLKNASWGQTYQVFIQPNIMGRNYPDWFKFVLSFANSNLQQEYEHVLKGSHAPYLNVALEEEFIPRVIVEAGRKALALDLRLRAKPQNLSGQLSNWDWKFDFPEGGGRLSFKEKGVAMKNTGSTASYRLKVGDPEVFFQAKATDDQGVEGVGSSVISGVQFWSSITVQDDPKEVKPLSVSPRFLSVRTEQIDADRLQKIMTGRSDFTRPSFSGNLSAEIANTLVLQANAGYAPYREGRIYAEEGNYLTEHLNTILWSDSREMRKLRKNIFGSRNPLQYDWSIQVKNLDGQVVASREHTGRFKRAVKKSDRRRIALVKPLKAYHKGDMVAIALPQGEPLIVEAEVMVRDQFGHTYTRRITTYNFQFTQALEFLEQNKGLTQQVLNSYLEELKVPKITFMLDAGEGDQIPALKKEAFIKKIYQVKAGYDYLEGKKTVKPEAFFRIVDLINEIENQLPQGGEKQ